MEPLAADEVRRAVQAALNEDLGGGDVTTRAVVPDNAMAKAVMRARERLVVAGLPFAEAAFRELGPDLDILTRVKDGTAIENGAILMELSGLAAPILGAERTALNFLQHLSGIASLTRQFVEAVQGTPAQILDTRKTRPGWRKFEKYAVACGGGRNHRFGLFDMVLIKDNHLASMQTQSAEPIAEALKRAREKWPALKIEIETDTLDQVDQAVAAGADLILLDNMNPVQLRLAVQKCKGRALTEASGGITLANARAIAETGVDFISVGALTHSARAVDIGLDFQLHHG